MIIETRLGLMDESELQLLEMTHEDNDDIKVTSAEWCVRDCPDSSHVTGIATGVGSFCAQHVKRSAHVEVKRMPEAMAGEAAALPGAAPPGGITL